MILLKLLARKENLYLWNKSTDFEKPNVFWLLILFFILLFLPEHIGQLVWNKCTQFSVLLFQNITSVKKQIWNSASGIFFYCSAEFRSEGYCTLFYWNRRWYFKKYLMGKDVPIWVFLYFKISQNILTFLPLAIAEVKDENISCPSWRITYSEGKKA